MADRWNPRRPRGISNGGDSGPAPGDLRFRRRREVDDGRLLAETDSVPVDQPNTPARLSGRLTIPIEVDFPATDGLEAERNKASPSTWPTDANPLNGRRVLIADAPGHEQYTRNMAVAASNGDVAILLVDAARGVRPQTHRHLTVCALKGVTTVIIAVNKMDLVEYEQAAFDDIVATVQATVTRLGVAHVAAIPMSAFAGDNVTGGSESMPWYSGPTLLEFLSDWEPAVGKETAGLRFPVQFIVRAEGNFRGYAGTVVSGSISSGDEVTVADSGRTARVDRIVTYDGDRSGGATSAVTGWR